MNSKSNYVENQDQTGNAPWGVVIMLKTLAVEAIHAAMVSRVVYYNIIVIIRLINFLITVVV